MPKMKESVSAAATALAAMGDVKKGFARVLRVSTSDKSPGASFWRAGVKHGAEPVDHPLDKFNPDQHEAIYTEPKLKAEYVDVKAGAEGEKAE